MKPWLTVEFNEAYLAWRKQLEQHPQPDVRAIVNRTAARKLAFDSFLAGWKAAVK